MGEAIDEAKQLNPDHTSLYMGRSAIVLADYAPYLFSFDTIAAFNDWYFSNGWGSSWGVVCRTNVPGWELYQHFRRFLMVQPEEAELIYFRFYDPRVLRRFFWTGRLFCSGRRRPGIYHILLAQQWQSGNVPRWQAGD